MFRRLASRLPGQARVLAAPPASCPGLPQLLAIRAMQTVGCGEPLGELLARKQPTLALVSLSLITRRFTRGVTGLLYLSSLTEVHRSTVAPLRPASAAAAVPRFDYGFAAAALSRTGETLAVAGQTTAAHSLRAGLADARLAGLLPMDMGSSLWGDVPMEASSVKRKRVRGPTFGEAGRTSAAFFAEP